MAARRTASIAGPILLCCIATSSGEEYLVGGPLAGVKLPLYKTQHGEPPGHPGCLPENGAQTADTEGLAGEWQLYDGSVEHWRAYWMKYCPVRSFFDRQSQLRYFVAAKLKGVAEARITTYAEPVYRVPRHARPVDTHKRNRPVAAVRCSPGGPVFDLELGQLDVGLYAVRIIGAVPTRHLRPFPLPAFAAMRVNDGPAGRTRTYRIRIGYQDEFYGIATLYFYAPRKRRYRAEVWIDKGTKVDVLVHGLSLDNVLAGAERRAVKNRGWTMHLADEIETAKRNYHARVTWARFLERVRKGQAKRPDPKDRADRWRRDALLWGGLPGPNCQPARPYGQGRGVRLQPDRFGVGDKSLEEIRKAHGTWEVVYPHDLHAPLAPADLRDLARLLVNRKLKLEYTLADLAAGKTLPDPYPHKDDGCGIYSPDPDHPAAGRVFWPVADALTAGRANGFARGYLNLMASGTAIWLAHGDETSARDAAVALLRFAYLFPTFDACRYLEPVTTDCWAFNRVLLRRRITANRVYGNFIRFVEPLRYYDLLFDYIRGSDDLAASVRRFVPWVQSPRDLVRLLDVYLVQMMAKRVLRYHYYGDGRQPWRIAEIAMCLGDNDFTRPWMRWLFTRTFFYPQPVAGIQDYAITGTDRDGRSPIGSYSYMIGEFSADRAAAALEKYVLLGGDPRWDLRDPRRFPKTRSSVEFYIRSRTAGLAWLRIGDVAGPDKKPWQYFDPLIDRAPTFWRWTKDPRWAWVVRHYAGRKAQSEDEWAEIEAAAAKVRRAPWFDNRSRVLPGWAALLETGLEYDDYRFRRSAMVRIGHGHGHAHHDGLDLQVHAHGLPMTVDAGQRSGYSQPNDRHTRVHNTVEVDGENWGGHSWAQALVDAAGARYVRCQGAHPRARGLFGRQVALIDVGAGRGAARAPTPKQMGPDPGGLPRHVTTPTSYVFDVFRAAGGCEHTYCFHATVNDPTGPQPAVNADNWRPPDEKSADERMRRAREYLAEFTNDKRCGTAPERLEALFHLQKRRLTPGRNRAGCEAFFTPKDVFDPSSPDKFTRLHLFGARGALVMKGDQHCHKWGYWIPHVFVQRRGAEVESAFAAIVEPYAGRPFLRRTVRLDVADNERDARAAVAIAVETQDGRRDLCFSDGRPDKVRRFADFSAAAEFALHSSDAAGVRQALLVGGTLLAVPGLEIRAEKRERAANIVRVDYHARHAWIDARWPAGRSERVVEIGDLGGDGYVTGFTQTAVRRDGERSVLTFARSADYYRSPVIKVDEAAGVVTCRLNVPGAAGDLTGMDRNFTATNDAGTKVWRTGRIRRANEFPLIGPPVRRADFAEGGALRLWEYGVGDRVRRGTFVSLRRVGQRTYVLRTDTACTVALAAASLRVSTDGRTYKPAKADRRGKLVVLSVPADRLAPEAVLHLRTAP